MSMPDNIFNAASVELNTDLKLGMSFPTRQHISTCFSFASSYGAAAPRSLWFPVHMLVMCSAP